MKCFVIHTNVSIFLPESTFHYALGNVVTHKVVWVYNNPLDNAKTFCLPLWFHFLSLIPTGNPTCFENFEPKLSIVFTVSSYFITIFVILVFINRYISLEEFDAVVLIFYFIKYQCYIQKG